MANYLFIDVVAVSNPVCYISTAIVAQMYYPYGNMNNGIFIAILYRGTKPWLFVSSYRWDPGYMLVGLNYLEHRQPTVSDHNYIIVIIYIA